MNTERVQKGKLQGSFMNYAMSNNKTLPEVGKGATRLLFSDRSAYQVMEVSEDQSRVVLKRCKSKRIDGNNFFSESQKYDYSELVERETVVVWRNNRWREEIKKIVLTKEAIERDMSYEEKKSLGLFDENGDWQLVDGLTKEKKVYEDFPVLWGVQDEYYDVTR
jgi:hypothetical protein